MRFSSIVSLVVVTASLALGGCAADAEPDATKADDNVAHEGEGDVVDRTDDTQFVGKYSEENHAFLTDEARARIIETYNGGAVDPRIDAHPPVFGPHARAAKTVTPEQMRDVVDEHTLGSSKP